MDAKVAVFICVWTVELTKHMRSLKPILAAACVALGSLVVLPLRAVDFQLQTRTVQEDGLNIVKSYFRGDSATLVQIDLPMGWNISSSAQGITLSPSSADCQVKIENSSLSPSLPFKGQGLDSYRRSLTAAIQGATDLQITEEKDSPLPIYNWKDYEFVLTYNLFGQVCRRSVIFINLNARDQIVLTSIAPKPQCEEIRSRALDVLRSWNAIPAKE